jgi:hypothetical protein
MIKVKFEMDGVNYLIEQRGHYSNGRMALQVYELGEDGPEPFMTLSYNFPDAQDPEEGYFYPKYWSENREFFMKMKRSGVLDFHPKEKESFYLSDKLLHRTSPIMTKIAI